MSVTLMTETNLYKDGAIAEGLEDASKVATNYLSYNQQDGLSVGRTGQSERAVIASDGMEIYDGLNDQIAQFKAVTRLGLAGGANLRLDYHSLQLQDIDGNTYVHLSDLRDANGYATINEDIIAIGTSQTTFSLSYDVTSANNILSVKVNDVQTTAYAFYRPSASSRYISLNTAPPVNSVVSVTYKTLAVYRAYTFGNRANGNIGNESFVHGDACIANGKNSFASGYQCQAVGEESRAEGYQCIAKGKYAHAEGDRCNTFSNASHAEGIQCSAGAENNGANTMGSHAEGTNCKATGRYCHAEGAYCTADGYYSHAEGYYCTSNSSNSHAEGYHSEASATGSHTEGYYTSATAIYSHAEGKSSSAQGDYAHVEGESCTASGASSHAEGYYCNAKSTGSHAEGCRTIASDSYQHVSGSYNVETATPVFIVGGGTSSSRKNALTLNTNGNMTIAGTLTQSSDKRLKHHRAYLSDQQNEVNEFINRLKPVWFEKDEQKHLGFYAQDVQQTDRWQCMIDTDTNGYLTLGYTEIIAPLVAYCQNLEQKVDALEERIARLEQLLNL